jgi:hypothetical protein
VVGKRTHSIGSFNTSKQVLDIGEIILGGASLNLKMPHKQQDICANR